MSESTEERPSCRCLRTHCLQLHCSCFRAAYFCSNNCECHDCRNREHRRTYAEEHYELAQKKNPKALAFKAPIVEETTQAPATVQEGDGGLSHVKGCSCRQIKCSNMSCGCFKSMVGCTYKCKCEGCANSYGIKLRDFVSKTEICEKKIIKIEKVASGIKQEQTDTSGIKQEQTDTSGIKQDQTDASGTKRMRSEDDSSSYPSKCLRIWETHRSWNSLKSQLLEKNLSSNRVGKKIGIVRKSLLLSLRSSRRVSPSHLPVELESLLLR